MLISDVSQMDKNDYGTHANKKITCATVKKNNGNEKSGKSWLWYV